jgi:serine/threonine protein kinase
VSVASEGELVAGRYRLVRPIERGGMAEVWEGHDENLDRAVAIKMLHGHLSGDAGFVSRFRREALSIAKLSHPNVVAIFDTGVDQRPPSTGGSVGPTRAYIVMELIRGESLRSLLQKGITMSKTVDIIRQAADGLAYAHRNGLVHRDVKPGNILVQTDGRVKVVDFGIAKLTDRRVDDTESSPWMESGQQPGEDLTQVGAILGTAKYLAPEQVEGGVIDARSDIYALGVVLYEGICGRPPFSGKNDLATAMRHVRETPMRPRQVRPGVPRSIEAVVLKAMARNPQDRYASADDLSAALRTIDLTPDDAKPDVSRTDDDITPSTPLVRTSGDKGSAASRRAPANVAPEGIDSRPGNAATDPTTVAVPPARPPRRAGSTPPDETSYGPISTSRPVSSKRRRRSVAARLAFLGVLGLLLGSAAGYAVSSVTRAPTSGRSFDRVGIASYDPFGDDGGKENDDLLKNAIDGKPDTTWRTSGYRSVNFNGSKPGVGIVVRLSDAATVGHVQVVSPSRGWSAKIYVADTIPGDFAGWGPAVGSLSKVNRNTTTVSVTKKRGSRVLLWITELAPKAPSQEFARVIIQEFSPRS